MSQRLNQAVRSVAKARLLLVDDEPSVRDALRRVLEVEGFDVSAAANGQDALEHLGEREPHLVLLDVNVASESGWDICRQLRSMKPDLHVIVITARPDQSAIALETGVDALMEKPLDLPQLLSIIGGLLASRDTGRQLQPAMLAAL